MEEVDPDPPPLVTESTTPLPTATTELASAGVTAMSAPQPIVPIGPKKSSALGDTPKPRVLELNPAVLKKSSL